jgi:spermidine synthase
LLTSGPYLYANRYQEFAAQKSVTLADAMRQGPRLLFFKEGLHAAVSVKRAIEGELMLGINGKTDATAHGDAPTQLMVGHLPLLLHPGARDVLVIGLGSGMTLGAVERYPVRAIDVVEVEPAVVEASRFFQEFTHDALADARVRLTLADGRNYLALTDQSYDVLISEPSNPWISGMANLFTREYFASARRHLRPGGIMCQWVQTYAMAPADVKTIVATFVAVFPDASVWEADLGKDYVLIGSAGATPPDRDRVARALAESRLQDDAVTMDMRDVGAFLSKLVLTADAVPAFTAGAPLNTDDNARVEYSAPRALLAGGSTALVAELYAHRSPLATKLEQLGRPAAGPPLRAHLDSAFQADGEIVAGYVAYANSQWVGAVTHLERARALVPGSYRAAYLLASLYNDLGHRVAPAQAREAYGKSLAVVAEYRRRDPRAFDAHFLLAVVQAQAGLQAGLLALNAGASPAAARLLEQSLSGPVRYPEAANNLGVAYERLGRYADARAQYEGALAAAPDYVPARMNLGNIYLREGRYADASARYREVLAGRPDYAAAYYNLGVAYYKQGQWRRAATEWRRALRYRPDLPEALQSLDLVRDSVSSR